MKQDRTLDLGSVQIHPKALAQIISSAVNEVEGVSLVDKNSFNKFLEFFGYDDHPGVDVSIDEKDNVTLEVKILVRYGMNIPQVAERIQSKIKEAIGQMADINLKDINIDVVGIERGQK